MITYQRKFMMKNKIQSDDNDNIESIKMNGFHKFCHETGLHGWSYLIRDMSMTWKAIWIVFLLVSISPTFYSQLL